MRGGVICDWSVRLFGAGMVYIGQYMYDWGFRRVLTFILV